MERHGSVWLVYNEASGSNDAAALSAVETALDRAGGLAGKSSFPDNPVPSIATLRQRGIDRVAVFAGDGTVHAVVTRLFGWEGAIIVLPGGTMNLLSRRLHGDADQLEIVSRVANGLSHKVRPSIIRYRHGCGLTGALAGPGTAWNDVREAMRETRLGDMAVTTAEALAESTEGVPVICAEPACGRSSGYVAITITPVGSLLEAKGYYSENIVDFMQQGAAILKHDFRNGPHDWLCKVDRLRLESRDDQPMGLLVDGEPFDGAAFEEFRVGKCEVDLLATRNGG